MSFGPSLSQLALFELGEVAPREVERRYSFDQLRRAAILSHGNKSEAARILRCSRTTVTKRYKSNARLREAEALGRELYLDISESVIKNPITRPCVYCRTPMIDAVLWFESCPRRDRVEAPIFKLCVEKLPDGNLCSMRADGHVAFINIDETERRALASAVLERLGADRGWGRRQDEWDDIPEAELRKIPDELIPEVQRRIEAGDKWQVIRADLKLVA